MKIKTALEMRNHLDKHAESRKYTYDPVRRRTVVRYVYHGRHLICTQEPLCGSGLDDGELVVREVHGRTLAADRWNGRTGYDECRIYEQL